MQARLGGPIGRWARSASWWTAVRVLVILTTISYAIGYLLSYPCRSNDWASPDRYEHLCYSDIPALFSLRGFADGYLPYLQTPPGGQPLEYPVLTGVFMQIAAVITKGADGLAHGANAMVTFFDVNSVLLLLALLAAVIACALTVRSRPWDALMIAISPSVIVAARINWDLLPLAFAGIALALWSRKRPFWAGVLLGLAIAAKFYPLIFLIGFAVLALRSGKWRAFGALVGGTAIAWLVVNVPFMVGNFSGWSYFYSFSSSRGQDFGSAWFAANLLGAPALDPHTLNVVATGLFIALAAAIAVVSLSTARRPRLAQVLLLLVIAFTITNKVYSPQYVLWLVPLVALARPRWRDYLIWQAGELIYFAAIWWFLVGYGTDTTKTLESQWYAIATFIHIAASIYLAVMVIRDMVRPDHDLIRNDGIRADHDDPGGGVFDGAPDVFSLSRTAADVSQDNASTARSQVPKP